MEEEIAKLFKDKRVIIFLYNKGIRRGQILNVSSSCLCIKDNKKGITTVEYKDIEEMNEDNQSFNGYGR